MQKMRFAVGGVRGKGFALPTVLIASIVLLTMLAVAVGSVNAVRVALQGQYYNQLAKEAAEAGLQMASACIEEGYTWSKPLRTGGDCYGSDYECTSDECYVVKSGNIRTSFRINTTVITNGDTGTITSVGKAELVRATSGEAWKTFTRDVRMNDTVVSASPSTEVTWKQVANGDWHSCAVSTDDWVYCWGAGTNGRLGNGGTTQADSPTPISRGAIPEGVKLLQVTAGNAHTCATASNGRAYCWGLGTNGRLGNGGATQALTPVLVSFGGIPAGARISQIAAGNAYTCATASNGRAYCWGLNSSGQLGNGGTTQAVTPVAIAQGAIPTTASIQQISVNNTHTCALASNGRAYCWGANGNGQLGTSNTSAATSPVLVGQGAIPTGITLQQVTNGALHTCAVGSNNRAYCWGYNASGQVGNNTTTQATSPVAVVQGAMPSGLSVQKIVTGNYYTCAISYNGKLYCWGMAGSGRLGNGSALNMATPVATLSGSMQDGTTIAAVATGDTHTCAIASDDRLYCWGSATSGKLGNGSTGVNAIVPADVNPVYDKNAWPFLQQVSLGSNHHSCGIASDRGVYCWGLNGNGQLGDGTTSDSTVPRPILRGDIPAGINLSEISLGNAHTCGLGFNSRIYCWGSNTSGQLGDGTTTQAAAPVTVQRGEMPAALAVRSVSAGGSHSCALAYNDQVYCWGVNTNGQLGNGTTTASSTPVAIARGQMPPGVTVRQVSAGMSHTCVVASNAKVYCWGVNTSGRLGNGGTAQATSPVAVSSGAIPANTAMKQVTAGGSFTCALSVEGKVYCWGNNGYGQLGVNSTTQATVPVATHAGDIPGGVSIDRIAAGNLHVCAVGSDSRNYCWGLNGTGQYGNGSATQSLTPVVSDILPNDASVRRVSAGGNHTCVTASDNRVYCAGYNANGQVGDGTTTTTFYFKPVNQGFMPSSERFRQISVGTSNTCGLTSRGAMYCWGSGAYGQLGSGSTTSVLAPLRVLQGEMPTNTIVRQVSAGNLTTCAVTANDQAYCWGSNTNGQLGIGTSSSVVTAAPVRVSRGSMPEGVGMKQISASASHACAIASDGQAYCWGLNTSGQLGTGSTTASFEPVAVSQGAIPAGVTFQSISTGGSHTCAIASNNQAYCWGAGTNGRLGNGGTAQATSPVAVSQGAIPAGVTFQSISAGNTHTCAQASNNALYCWGNNGNGQLGVGSTTQATSPVAVSAWGLPIGGSIQQVSSGTTSTCAYDTSPRAYCWGLNSSGQLGNGTTTQSTSPTSVQQGELPPGDTIVSISNGSAHSCLLSSSGYIYCWGSNGNGRLGVGSAQAYNTPAAVTYATSSYNTLDYLFLGPRRYF